MSDKTRNSELLESFGTFCRQNPDLRFWQALRSWSGADSILYEEKNRLLDTFYWEGKTR